MTGPLTITLEPAKALSATAEVRLLRDGLVKNPASTPLRSKLGEVLNELDQFDETITLLAPVLDKLDSNACLVLARACFALHDTGHLELAGAAADRALAVAAGDPGRARAMADQAKVHLRRDASAAAIGILRAALALDRQSVAAFKRLALQLLRQGDLAAIEQLTAELISAGVCHSRVLAARMMALAALGRDDEARTITDLAHRLHCAQLAPPPGWTSLSQLNAALVTELTGNSALRYDRFGTASTRTWRVDSPMVGATPAWIALLDQVARLVEVWASDLAPSGHPWLAARPERAMLRSWCVITGAEGHERWHMHPDGWLSGGYYPVVPSGLASPANRAGCLSFGLPDGLPGTPAAKRFGEVTVRPEAGLLTLFPSHAFHRTYPHGSPERRICVAFDVIPL